MKPILNVYALPRYSEPEDFVGGTAIVIDILRAATTIAYALDAGATEVFPCLEIEDALALAKKYDDEEVVLGGEREGVAIDGFQLGNSPEEYTPDRVGGKKVIFTTTNGTRAMIHARLAEEIYVASFVNVSAVAARLLECERVHILCAGTDGRISEDDVLFAGMLVDRLQRQTGDVYQQNAQAITSREFWLNAFSLPHAVGAEPLAPERLAEPLRKSLGGQNLIAIGMDEDILAAAHIDRFHAVPRLDPKKFRITLSE